MVQGIEAFFCRGLHHAWETLMGLVLHDMLRSAWDTLVQHLVDFIQLYGLHPCTRETLVQLLLQLVDLYGALCQAR